MLVGSDQEPAMNAFYEHHRDSIRFGDRWHYLANWRMQVATQKLRNTSASPSLQAAAGSIWVLLRSGMLLTPQPRYTAV
jgi:hypothetical protein